jgi:hypothetical protein
MATDQASAGARAQRALRHESGSPALVIASGVTL